MNCLEKLFSLNFSANNESLLACNGDQESIAFSNFITASSIFLKRNFSGTNSLGPPESCTIGKQPKDIASIIAMPKCSFSFVCRKTLELNSISFVCSLVRLVNTFTLSDTLRSLIKLMREIRTYDKEIFFIKIRFQGMSNFLACNCCLSAHNYRNNFKRFF